MDKYSGITEHNKAAFDAIVPKVKEAISKGQIPIPAGGTKLYKHTIILSVNNVSTTIYIINTIQSKYTTKGQIAIGFGSSPYVSVIDVNGNSYIVDGANSKLYKIVNDAVTLDIDLYASTTKFTSDNVTTL